MCDPLEKLPTPNIDRITANGGSKREYRMFGTPEFFQRLDKFLESEKEDCISGWIPHLKDFHDWM